MEKGEGHIFCGILDANSTHTLGMLSMGSSFVICNLDISLLVIHVIYIAAATLIAIYVTKNTCTTFKTSCRCSRSDRKYSPRVWVKLPLNVMRWIITFVLMLVCVTLVAEGALVETQDPSTNSPSFYVPHLMALLGLATSMVLYDKTEKMNKPRVLSLCLVYWALNIVCFSMKVSAMESYQIMASPRFVFSSMALSLYVLLLLVETYTLISLRYLCGNRERKLCSPGDINAISYVQKYVCMPSQVTWHWMTSFLQYGRNKELTIEDLGQFPASEQAITAFRKFKHIYTEEEIRAAAGGDIPSLWRCYVTFSWRHMTLTGLVKLVADQMFYLGPVLVSYIVHYATEQYTDRHNNVTDMALFTNSTGSYLEVHVHTPTFDEYFSNGYILALFMLMSTVVCTFFWQNQFFHCLSEGIKVKGAVQNMVLDKVLRLSSSAQNDDNFNHGKIVNHVSTDALNIFWMFYVGHFAWQLPVTVTVGIMMLYSQLGSVALLGGILFAIMAPVNYMIGRTLSRIQDKTMEKADDRLKQSKELFECIKLLKLYAWETIFCEKIFKTRRTEARFLMYSALLRITSLIVVLTTPLTACLATILLYPVIESEPLETGKLYSVIAIYGILGLSLWIVYFVVNVIGHGYVSTRRIQKFLHAQEVQMNVKNGVAVDGIVEMEKVPLMKRNISGEGSENESHIEAASATESYANDDGVTDNSRTLLKMNDASFSWSALNDADSALHHINWELRQGQLVIIVGPVGCGKSSLLSAILGEMFLQQGSFNWQRKPRVAYVPQKAWLMNASVEKNVLFNGNMNIKTYNHILDICALRDDLEIMPAGDQTEIGEKGINLSGGQKQRISLARAVYSGAELVLLDDPLSALDAPVANHIFTKVIMDYLLPENRTVVLVTHQIRHLHNADWIISMQGGRIVFQGPPSSLSEDTEQQIAERLRQDEIKANSNKQKEAPNDVTEGYYAKRKKKKVPTATLR